MVDVACLPRVLVPQSFLWKSRTNTCTTATRLKNRKRSGDHTEIAIKDSALKGLIYLPKCFRTNSPQTLKRGLADDWVGAKACPEYAQIGLPSLVEVFHTRQELLRVSSLLLDELGVLLRIVAALHANANRHRHCILCRDGLDFLQGRWVYICRQQGKAERGEILVLWLPFHDSRVPRTSC